MFSSKKNIDTSLVKRLQKIITQGNNQSYQALINTIVLIHEAEFTEENLATKESFILTLITNAFNIERKKCRIEPIENDALFLKAMEFNKPNYIDFDKVTKDKNVIDLLKQREEIENKIKDLDANALINYELEVLAQ